MKTRRADPPLGFPPPPPRRARHGATRRTRPKDARQTAAPSEPWSSDLSYQGQCSGDWTAGLIADTILVPAHLPAGDYVLGLRYDCEETAQVWQNCADLKVVAAEEAVVESA